MRAIFRDPKTAMAERLQQLELAHAERMRAIESGQAVPEVEKAWAETLKIRSQAIVASIIVRTVFMAVGPAAICGIAVGASGVIFQFAEASQHQSLLQIVWTVAAIVCVAIVSGLWAIGKQCAAYEMFQGSLDDDSLSLKHSIPSHVRPPQK